MARILLSKAASNTAKALPPKPYSMFPTTPVGRVSPTIPSAGRVSTGSAWPEYDVTHGLFTGKRASNTAPVGSSEVRTPEMSMSDMPSGFRMAPSFNPKMPFDHPIKPDIQFGQHGTQRVVPVWNRTQIGGSGLGSQAQSGQRKQIGYPFGSREIGPYGTGAPQPTGYRPGWWAEWGDELGRVNPVALMLGASIPLGGYVGYRAAGAPPITDQLQDLFGSR